MKILLEFVRKFCLDLLWKFSYEVLRKFHLDFLSNLCKNSIKNKRIPLKLLYDLSNDHQHCISPSWSYRDITRPIQSKYVISLIELHILARKTNNNNNGYFGSSCYFFRNSSGNSLKNSHNITYFKNFVFYFKNYFRNSCKNLILFRNSSCIFRKFSCILFTIGTGNSLRKLFR